MFCPNCGADNPDTQTFCSNCGASLKAAQRKEPVRPAAAPAAAAPFKDNMVYAIVALASSFMCCSSGGINGLLGLLCVSLVQLAAIVLSAVAVANGSAAQKAHAAGDDATAQAKAKSVKTLSIIALVLVGLGALATIVLFILSFALGVGMGVLQNSMINGGY